MELRYCSIACTAKGLALFSQRGLQFPAAACAKRRSPNSPLSVIPAVGVKEAALHSRGDKRQQHREIVYYSFKRSCQDPSEEKQGNEGMAKEVPREGSNFFSAFLASCGCFLRGCASTVELVWNIYAGV